VPALDAAWFRVKRTAEFNPPVAAVPVAA